jgi:hypothetical protein
LARRALDTPDGETTQAETGIVGVARQAPALAAAGLVEELKAESEKKREHELDKRFGVAQELSVSRLIMEIDGERAVVACRFGGLSHVSSPISAERKATTILDETAQFLPRKSDDLRLQG